MYFDEHIPVQVAQERIEEAIRWAERCRALGRVRPALRVRLGRVLLRLGFWLTGERFTAESSQPARF